MLLMKSSFACFLVLIFINPLAAGEVPLPDVWTMKSAIKFALKNNPDSHVAMKRIEASQAMIALAQANYSPRIDLTGEYGQTNNPMYSFGNILNQGEFNQSIDFNEPGRTDNLNFKASISYNLYNGGRDQAGLTAAQASAGVSKNSLTTIRAILSFEVVRGYLKIAQAMDMREARTSAMKAIEASLAVAKSRFEAGDLLKADLLNLEVQYSRARENLILSRHHYALAQKGFLNLLGLRGNTAKITRQGFMIQEMPEITNFDKRPELQGLDLAITAAEARLEQARGGNLPTLDGFALYQYDKGFETDGSGDSWMAGLKVNYTLYQGQRTKARISASQAEVARLKMEKRKLELAMDLELARAKLNHNQAKERMTVTDKMVEQAKESARLSRVRFKEGVILSSDLIDTETRLTDALVRQTIAKTDILVAVADLRKAVGLPQYQINQAAAAQ